MSKKKEHRKRYEKKRSFYNAVYLWSANEPPIWHYIKWLKWKNSRPKLGDF